MESFHAMYKKFSCMFPSLSSSSDKSSLPIDDDWIDYSKEGQISPKKKPETEIKTKIETVSTETPVLNSHEKRMLAHKENQAEQKRRIEELDKQLVIHQASAKKPIPRPIETLPELPQPILFTASSINSPVSEKSPQSLLDLTEQPGSEVIVPVPPHANLVPQPSPYQPTQVISTPDPILTIPPISLPVVLDPRTSAHRKGY